MISFRHAASSHVGLVRTGNEDSGYADAHLLVVADGMGGHAAGELASAAVVAAVCADLGDRPTDSHSYETWVRAKVDAAHQRIGDLIIDDPERRGMGTTFTLMGATEDHLVLAHVGDSRAYRLRGGELSQLTRDHTYVQMLVDTGRLRAEEAASHPRRNLLLRTIDGIHELELDVEEFTGEIGDRYLLCSDGLTTVLHDDAIADVLRSGDPTYAVATLIDYALAGGAPDNVSVIVADLMDTQEQMDAILIGAAREDAVRVDLGEVPLPVDGPPVVEHAVSALAIARQRSRWFVAGAIAATLVLLIFGRWTMGQWYVTEIDGRVALFQGVSQSLGPMPLSRLDMLTDLRTDALPVFDRQQVRSGISTASRADAEAVISRIRQSAATCAYQPDTVGCP